MSAKGGSNVFFDKVMPMIYGLGAAIVIVGAMFKIMHWPGAGVMLVVGLSTEAFIFAVSAFQPIHKEPDWSKVYPQLAEDGDVYEETEEASSTNITKKLDDMMSDANINQDTISKLGASFNNLSSSVSNLKEISDASVASSEYAGNLRNASKSLLEMNKSYSITVDAMSEMANASQDAKEYHNQVQSITKNLGALNAVYEMELQDANNHLRAMNKFYGNLSSAMESMSDASKDTQNFKEELSKLTKNLNSLNGVYGSMLSAMKG